MPNSSSSRSAALLLTHLFRRFQGWFAALTPLNKLLIILVVTGLSFALLNLLLQALSALVVLAVILVALYGIVQLWLSSSPSDS